METEYEALPALKQTRKPQKLGLSPPVLSAFTASLDATIIAGTGLLIYLVYVHGLEPHLLSAYLVAIAAMTGLCLQTFWLAGFYRFGNIVDPVRPLTRLIAIYSAVFLILLATAFLLKISDSYSRVWAVVWLVSTVVLLPVGRMASARMLAGLARRDVFGRNIVVYGAGAQGAAIIRHIENNNRPWDRVIAVFDDRTTRTETESMGYPVTGDLDALLDWARDNRVDEILVALPWSANARLLSVTESLSVLPSDVRLSPEFIASDLLHRQISYMFGVPMLNLLTRPVSGTSAIWKQAMDYLLGFIFLLIAAPIMLAIAVWVKLDSPGPVFFRQPRYGFNNQLFDMFKFRTMHASMSDPTASKLTERNDPRVTRAGAFLRRSSLDELPQLFNVLRGEMSVVGPRPHAVEAKAGSRRYEEVVEKYAFRHKVKPGMTGWAQVNGWRGNTETEDDLIGRLEHDLYYIDNWSVALDLVIILRTFFVMVRGENSY